MNVISLVGRLTEQPELKQTNGGKSVVSVSIAVDRPFAKDTTDFIPLVVWGQPAEYLSKYGKKGSKVAVSGYLTTRKYEDKSGNKRTAYEVVVNTVELCESASSNNVEIKAQPYMPSAYTQPHMNFSNSPQFEEIPGDESLPF